MLAHAHLPLKKGRKMAESIWTLTDAQLSEAQAKITYLGEQTKIVPTVTFAVKGHNVVIVRFLDVQRSGKSYINDESPYTKNFNVSREEFKSILSALQGILKSGAEDKRDFLSFTVVAGTGNAFVGEECLVPRSKGKQFYNALLQSLSPDNTEAHTIVRTQFKNVYPNQSGQ